MLFQVVNNGGGLGGGFGGGWGGRLGMDGGGRSGADFGAFQPNVDGFNNSEPLGGYAGTTPSYESITNLDRVQVTAPKPDTNTYNPIPTLFDQSIPTLDTVTSTAP